MRSIQPLAAVSTNISTISSIRNCLGPTLIMISQTFQALYVGTDTFSRYECLKIYL